MSYDELIPIDFYDEKWGADWQGMQEDLRLRLTNEHVGMVNGISTLELTKIYFGRIDMEARFCMENQLQIIRQQLLSLYEPPLILRNASYRWHIAETKDEHFNFIVDRSKRIVRAYGRTQVVTQVATNKFPELENKNTIKAIGSMSKPIGKLRSAITKDNELLTEGKLEE